MKEMVAGCCVCSDERGWTENPLVYCDGVGCNIAVHQACYGIVSVPSGNWYCRKCESQERSARVRCELCPSKDGALKRTDNGGWAHVVCGLYIPEVRFGSVTTMEPIVLSQIPTERYNKVCYICEQNNRGSRASVGACMQCNKAGCKQQFHVTCAQAMGLLCEEAGNYLDNVKYCGYCQEHYMKLKKGSNVKTIPPYRPLSNNSGSEESPEKKIPVNYSQTPADLKQIPKRKSMSNRPLNQNGPTRSTAADRKETVSQTSSDQINGSTSTNIIPSIVSQIGKNDNSSKFTTSNFVESVITPSESVFADMQKSKKRKHNEQSSSPVNIDCIPESELNSSKLSINQDEEIDDEDSTLHFIEEPNLSTLKPEIVKTSTEIFPSSTSIGSTNVTTVISSVAPITSNVTILPTISASVSQNNSFLNPVSSSYLSTASFSDVKSIKCDNQVDKNRTKQKRPLTVNNNGSGSLIKKSSKIGDRDSPLVNGPADLVTPFTSSGVSIQPERSNSTQSAASVKSESMDLNLFPTQTEMKDSPPTSPENSITSKSSKTEDRPEKEFKSFQSGSSAPHMLGNQLNPSSSMAQKMSEALNDELEAHSIFTSADSNTNTSNFVGPPLYNKILSSTRASDSAKRSSSPSSGPLASLSSSAANFPQTLEELLETQWEQGGTFLMEQAQHFDIASLLTCLHKLREENLGLEEHIRKLKARRDHLLGVNARLAMPLAPISQPVNNVHTSSQTPLQHPPAVSQTISQMTGHHPHLSHIVQQQQQQQQQQQSQQHGSHTQQHYQQSNPSQLSADSSNLRNIPLPSNMYSSSTASTILRGPHGSVFQNPHSMENGLPPTQPHHQHSRGVPSQTNPGAIRHHSSTSNATLFATNQSVSNAGVVVRTPSMPDMSRNDRRNVSGISSNYQQSYQMSSLSHQHQQQQKDVIRYYKQ